jgi:hypothetical protein
VAATMRRSDRDQLERHLAEERRAAERLEEAERRARAERRLREIAAMFDCE